MTPGDGFFFADFLPPLFFAVITDADFVLADFVLADFLLDFFDGMFFSLVDNQSDTNTLIAPGRFVSAAGSVRPHAGPLTVIVPSRACP